MGLDQRLELMELELQNLRPLGGRKARFTSAIGETTRRATWRRICLAEIKKHDQDVVLGCVLVEQKDMSPVCPLSLASHRHHLHTHTYI